MMLNRTSAVILILGSMIVGAAAHAVPVQYRFTTGTAIGSGGSALGLFGAGETANGTFTYESDSVAIGAIPFPLGDASVYGSITNWEGFVGANRFFDAAAGVFVGNDVLTGGLDTMRLTGTVEGGPWVPFSVGGVELVRATIIFQEGLFGATNFLTSNAQPESMPSFLGLLRLDFSGNSTSPSGFVHFGGVRVERVSVPEPGTLFQLLAGLIVLAVIAVRRRRRGEVLTRLDASLAG